MFLAGSLWTLLCFVGGVPLDDSAMIWQASDSMFLGTYQIRCSIVVSISACHAEDPGSIPGGAVMCHIAGAKLHPGKNEEVGGNGLGERHMFVLILIFSRALRMPPFAKWSEGLASGARPGG